MAGDAFLESLFDEKKLRILKLFLNNPEEEFYLREISRQTKVSDASTFRIILLLSKLNLVETIKIKKLKLYKLAKNNDTKFLENLLKDEIRALDTFLEEISKIGNIEQVILHGDEKKDRANILLIGPDMPVGMIKSIVAGIKERFNFTISTLALAQDQYEQMSSMGLYSGKKKILYQK